MGGEEGGGGGIWGESVRRDAEPPSGSRAVFFLSNFLCPGVGWSVLIIPEGVYCVSPAYSSVYN